MKTEKELKEGCGEIALQVGYNRTYCGERILCIKCKAKLETLQERNSEVKQVIKDLNVRFRKDNTPQRLSGDEFNDLWEEKLLQKLRLGK